MNKEVVITIVAKRYTFCPNLAAIVAEFNLSPADCFRSAGTSSRVVRTSADNRANIVNTVAIW